MRRFRRPALAMSATLGGMNSDATPRRRTVATTLILFVATLVALRIGRFIQFDDRSGFGDADMILPLGAVAVALAVASLVTSLKDPVARRSLGVAMAALDVSLVAIAATDDGFRFVWTTYEGELLQFEVVLGLVALVLLTPAFLRPPDTAAPDGSPARQEGAHLTAWARGILYLCALAVGMFIAFLLGAAHFHATQCNGPGGGECDIAPLEGMVWAAGALLLGVVVIVIVEIRSALTRRPSRNAVS